MSDNLEEFTRDLERAAEELPAAEVKKLHGFVHMQALRRIVFRTPRDLGTTVGNWQSSSGSPATGILPLRSEEEVIAEGERVVAQLQPFSVSYLTNNAEHILVLELGEFDPPDPGPSRDPRKGRKGRELVKGGFSVQAPRGMVAITVEELRQQFDLEEG